MKIRCAKHQLLEGIQLVGRTVSTRTPLPILECILLSATESGLQLTANNLEMSIETAHLPAEVEAPGTVALEAKLFSEIVRKMPEEGVIAIETDDHHVTVCKSGKTRFQIMGMPGEEFPVMPAFDEAQKNSGCTIAAKDLRDMIRQTIFSVATDDAKPILTGELLQYRDGGLNMVAVDGFRLSYRRPALPAAPASELSLVIPAKALSELSRILPAEDDEQLTFHYTDKRILFELPQFTFSSRLLEGEFIRYDQIFNGDFTTNVTLTRTEFLTGLERACTVARENKKSPVKLDIEEQSVVITSNTEMGAAHDEVPAQVDGGTFSIAFNPRYLMEALRAIDEESVVVRFTTNMSPCIIRGVESEDCKYLILPLRNIGT